MDFEEQFRRLKKERASRTKPQRVEKAWEKLSREEELSVKERLQKLIALTGDKKEKEKPAKKVPLAPPQREPLQAFENSFPLEARYGKNRIAQGLEVAGEILYYLSRESQFKKLDLSGSLFIDLETTGLSGGAGTIPFLVGMGFYRDNKFKVVQHFLGELAEEERMIQELGRFFAQMNFRSIVSYNGKGFDLPILEGRFILYRQPFMLSELPHLDLLFSARSLWKHKHESCRLYHLAREIVEADRSEDIPSAEVPLRYFEYLRTSDFSLIEPILYHNQEDLLSLLGLVIVGSKLFPKSGKEVDEEFIDAMDLFGVAKVLENAGDSEKSVLFFQRALEGRLSSDTALAAKKRLARHFKKSHDWDKAVPLWQEMTKLDQLFCFRELAMHFEHRDKNYEEAKKIAEEGLALAMNVSESYQHDFAHRLERLDAKIAKKKENPGRR